MNIGQLRRALAELPVDMPVVIDDCQMGWMTNAAVYLAPAHVAHGIAGNQLNRHHREGADNCEALLISSLGQTDVNTVDITPRTSPPQVIDVDLENLDDADVDTRQLNATPEAK